MIAFLLTILGFGKSVMTAVLTWLSRRSLGEVGFIILACLAMFLLFRANHWKSVATERQGQLVKCGDAKKSLQDQLNAISSKKNEQQVVTKTNIVTVTKLVHDAEGKAKVVEAAPDAPDCKTPPAILGADL